MTIELSAKPIFFTLLTAAVLLTLYPAGKWLFTLTPSEKGQIILNQLDHEDDWKLKYDYSIKQQRNTITNTKTNLNLTQGERIAYVEYGPKDSLTIDISDTLTWDDKRLIQHKIGSIEDKLCQKQKQINEEKDKERKINAIQKVFTK